MFQCSPLCVSVGPPRSASRAGESPIARETRPYTVPTSRLPSSIRRPPTYSLRCGGDKAAGAKNPDELVQFGFREESSSAA
ncbi:unnamed protein product [Arctogadus glacialis]